ncbi:2-oxo acid dehydrogenase subunit E2 [Glutamicibacter sp. MNS18]|uniref:dihydrolipoamide acetyltransferase family protein n=1 Tax=Glutamicibacter sp. MNS18 TaxID=2989817 RepID=UPI002236B62F|nr:dihydrolipoamide acetyltransferase family protein [Glutamicibacter sp. MNS18]MCW4465224.1 2-oxo acid dehydrogenase subunit E2 [Glutamicibacter sp. MNS18]
MNAAQIFKLPDLGEGLTESEVLNWKIRVGQRVELNQVIAEVETAKAVVELPSPYAGVVEQLHAEAGEVVPVGSPLVTFADRQDPGQPAGSGPAPAKRTPTLVGYGAEPSTGQRPVRRARRGAAAPTSSRSGAEPVLPGPADRGRAQAPDSPRRSTVPRSTPPVRKFARDHGVDLATIRGTGRDGLIVRADVQAALDAATSGTTGRSQESTPPSPVSGDGDRVVKLSAVRRATAKAMVESAFTAPHATEFLTVDVTASLDLLERLRDHRSLRGQHVNFTTLLALVVTRLLGTHRALNSSWDGANDQIIEHGSVNLGMAVSTERGLLVPVVAGAHRMGLGQLAQELSNIIEHGRAGTLSPQQLGGGTFSITNVGVFGIDAGTPILPPGQSAILAVGQIKRRPWEYQGELALRHTATLALSFDHRLIDGKEGSEFLADLGHVLENPGMVNLFL